MDYYYTIPKCQTCIHRNKKRNRRRNKMPTTNHGNIFAFPECYLLHVFDFEDVVLVRRCLKFDSLFLNTFFDFPFIISKFNISLILFIIDVAVAKEQLAISDLTHLLNVTFIQSSCTEER